MKINDNDIAKILADLPEIELPEGFHDEVMAKIKEVGAASGRPKKRPLVRYIGPFVAAAALVFIVMAVLDFGPSPMDYGGGIAQAPIAAIAEAEVEAELWATPSMARAFDEDFDAFDDAFENFEWYSDYELFGTGIAVAFVGGSLEEQFENAGFPTSIVSHMFFPYGPDHLPTDNLHFDTEYRFAITFDITILVEDLAQATHALNDLGAQAPVMALQPAFEDLEATFTALYALGTVQEYHMTITDAWALMVSGPRNRIASAWEEANTINVIFIEK
ncbi:MAG: hypothetical protein FWC76_03695 [Defluviitaleaceae bacterium]|nr:hypothetical protein [Defluviitaleaceae bacterium]